MTEKKYKYDLEDRTAKFGETVILFCLKIKQNAITKPLISQIVRSSTSVGANYMEANGASSRKDFRNKIYICRKEIQETKHWLRMLKIAIPNIGNSLDILEQEAKELTLIFSSIASSINKNP